MVNIPSWGAYWTAFMTLDLGEVIAVLLQSKATKLGAVDLGESSARGKRP